MAGLAAISGSAVPESIGPRPCGDQSGRRSPRRSRVPPSRGMTPAGLGRPIAHPRDTTRPFRRPIRPCYRPWHKVAVSSLPLRGRGRLRSMYLIDTSLVSLFDPQERAAASDVIAWMERHDRLLVLSAITLLELERGLMALRRSGAEPRAAAIEALRDALLRDFGPRLLPVDAEVALIAARLAEVPEAGPLPALLVAATARAHGLTVLTRDPDRFAAAGVAALNPPRRPAARHRGLSSLALASQRFVRLALCFATDFCRKTGHHFCEICLAPRRHRQGGVEQAVPALVPQRQHRGRARAPAPRGSRARRCAARRRARAPSPASAGCPPAPACGAGAPRHCARPRRGAGRGPCRGRARGTAPRS